MWNFQERIWLRFKIFPCFAREFLCDIGEDMSSTLARDCAFKLVFQEMFSEDFLLNDFFDESMATEEDKEYALKVLEIIKQNRASLDEYLQNGLTKGLKLKDLYTLDHAILVMAIAQIEYLKEDKPLVINESVRLAKKYSTDKSPSFINGVLSSLFKN